MGYLNPQRECCDTIFKHSKAWKAHKETCKLERFPTRNKDEEIILKKQNTQFDHNQNEVD